MEAMKIQTLWGEEEVKSRACKKCGAEKPYSEFEPRNPRSPRGELYVRGACLECRRLENKKVSNLRKKHPYPKNHRCEICNASESECMQETSHYKRAFCLDHNHQTGEFRGWLCHDCNRALGQFKDSTEILERAIKYVKNGGVER